MASSPIFTPSSDKRYWSILRSRIDTLLENRSSVDSSLPHHQVPIIRVSVFFFFCSWFWMVMRDCEWLLLFVFFWGIERWTDGRGKEIEGRLDASA